MSQYQLVLIAEHTASDKKHNKVQIMLHMQPFSLTFNVFLAVFVSDHLNGETLQANYEGL